ncbi:coiled-coil domain-containing protein 25-like, partial [Corapipo altera]|uniref:coiled-coil domain-containing protein 25-like n=1 Tax=Corapipo altera TaxID=415028 RepID=UPI000FD63C09
MTGIFLRIWFYGIQPCGRDFPQALVLWDPALPFGWDFPGTVILWDAAPCRVGSSSGASPHSWHVSRRDSQHVSLCDSRHSQVKVLTVEKKVNEILNRLEKTKVERFPDLAAEREARDREERNEKKAQIQEMKRREKEELKKKKELEELRSYSSLMKAENMSSNQ